MSNSSKICITQSTVNSLLDWKNVSDVNKKLTEHELINKIYPLKYHLPFTLIALDNTDEIELLFYADDKTIIKGYYISLDDNTLNYVSGYKNKKIYN